MFKFEAFDVVAGSSDGIWNDVDNAIAILNVIESACTGTPMAKYWKELAMEQATESSTDIDYYANLLEEHCADLLPPYTAFTWVDGELRVEPCVEQLQEDINNDELGSGDELPDSNLENEPFFAVISDHGNLTLYAWQTTCGSGGWFLTYHWVEIWGVV